MTTDCSILVASFKDASQYTDIEKTFDSFQGRFVVQKCEDRFEVYTNEIGQLLYESMYVFELEHSIAFLI